ncbi:NAD(P)-dependent oxidoreductase [Numidum massiliense]|uniref:NAD(P)-dependent oxidoreductase n=1 Tax=Numidum massiliense TaxID=1522315 RepID=UPI0006D5966E|nr:NAD(P)-dependent oxidoreductase [Numidum massiliense]
MKRIGVIGLGKMGLPMAKNLLQSGFEVHGIDVNREAERALAEEGGQIGSTIPELVQKVDAILTSLPTPGVVKDVYLGTDGLLAHTPKRVVLVDTSTVSPSLNVDIGTQAKEKGLKYVGAPVSGGVIGAVNRTLTFMVGGPRAVLDDVHDIVNVLGANIFHVGENEGSGTVVKLMNNLFIGFYTSAVAEVLTLAKECGIAHEQLFDILNVSYGQSRIYERNYKEYIAAGDYTPGFTISLLLKDLDLAMELADAHGLNLPVSKMLAAVYEQAEQEGYGANDMAYLYEIVKAQAGARVAGS